MSAHQPKPYEENKRYYFSYEHAAERLLERYRLFLTPEIWDQWHDAIRTGTDAIYVCQTVDAEAWRVKYPGENAVFVAVRDGIIRTVLPNTGWHIPAARVAAKAIGETSLGIKLPPIQLPPVQRPKSKSSALTPADYHAEKLIMAAQLKKKYETKMDNVRRSAEMERNQAQLFIKVARQKLCKEAFAEIWDLAKTLFPDHPAWR